MKLSTSFAPPVVRLVVPVTAGLWVTALILLAVAALLVQRGWAMRAEAPAMDERLAQIELQLKKLETKESAPSPAELNTVKDRVAAINTLTGIRGWPAPMMLAKLEQLLPDPVYLVSLNHKLKDGEVHVLAESTNAEALTGFLKKLEKEPHFSEVMLVRQTQRGTRGDHAIQFEVRLKERP